MLADGDGDACRFIRQRHHARFLFVSSGAAASGGASASRRPAWARRRGAAAAAALGREAPAAAAAGSLAAVAAAFLDPAQGPPGASAWAPAVLGPTSSGFALPVRTSALLLRLPADPELLYPSGVEEELRVLRLPRRVAPSPALLAAGGGTWIIEDPWDDFEDPLRSAGGDDAAAAHAHHAASPDHVPVFPFWLAFLSALLAIQLLREIATSLSRRRLQENGEPEANVGIPAGMMTVETPGAQPFRPFGGTGYRLVPRSPAEKDHPTIRGAGGGAASTADLPPVAAAEAGQPFPQRLPAGAPEAPPRPPDAA